MDVRTELYGEMMAKLVGIDGNPVIAYLQPTPDQTAAIVAAWLKEHPDWKPEGWQPSAEEIAAIVAAWHQAHPEWRPEGWEEPEQEEPEPQQDWPVVPPPNGVAVQQVSLAPFHQTALQSALDGQKRVYAGTGGGKLTAPVKILSGMHLLGCGATKGHDLGTVFYTTANLGKDGNRQRALIEWERDGATGVLFSDFGLDGTGGNDGIYATGLGNGTVTQRIRFFGAMRHCFFLGDNPADDSAAWVGDIMNSFVDGVTGSYVYADTTINTTKRGPIVLNVWGGDIRINNAPFFDLRNGQPNEVTLTMRGGKYQGISRSLVKISGSENPYVSMWGVAWRAPRVGACAVEFMRNDGHADISMTVIAGTKGSVVKYPDVNGKPNPKNVAFEDFPDGNVKVTV